MSLIIQSMEARLPTLIATDPEKIPQDSPEEKPEFPSGKNVALTMVALFLAMFLIALDRTSIATAVPQFPK
jgi:hypothetical protein